MKNMRLSLTESRTRGYCQHREVGNPGTLQSGRQGRGVTDLGSCYSDGESFETCSFLPELAADNWFARDDKVATVLELIFHGKKALA